MSAEADLVISGHLAAPPARVWEAWTGCDEVRRWWGPAAYTTPYCRMDLRVGGSFLLCMRSPEGTDYWSTGTYKEIVPGRRLVSTDSFADEMGNTVSPTQYGFGPDFPEKLELVVTFEERDGETELTIRHRGIPLGEDYGHVRKGWSESLRKLENVLEPVMAGAVREPR
jgi:uncharacterized protein YndB with AHSA1/START domain